MNSQDLLLMEKIADKELKFWCLIHDRNHRENDDKWEVLQVLSFIQNIAWWYPDMVYYQTKYAQYTQKREWINHIFNEKMDYRFKWKNEWELRYKILWTPPWLARCLWWIEFDLWVSEFRHIDLIYNIQEDIWIKRDLSKENLVEQPQEVKDFIHSLISND